VRVRLSYWRFSERNFTLAFCTFSTSSLVPLQRFNASTIQRFTLPKVECQTPCSACPPRRAKTFGVRSLDATPIFHSLIFH
jgi:hypothetical protein